MKHSLWASTAIQFFILKLNRATPRIARMMKTRAGMAGAGALVLGVSLAVTIPEATLAQQNEEGWTQTNDPVKDPDNLAGTPKGWVRPEGCTRDKLLTQQLVAYCVATSTGFFWRWYDFDTYVCLPNETPTFRKIAYTRSTNAPCNKKMWERTKAHTKLYGEDWTVNNSMFNSETLADPPSGGTNDPPPLGEGKRPDGRTAEVLKVPEEKTTTEKTETKTETGKTSDNKTSDSKTDKRPRKEVKKTKTHHTKRARNENSDTQTHAPELIGIGVGVGLLGGGGRGRERGTDRSGHRMGE